MKLKSWLKYIDCFSLSCNIYINNEEDPIFCGSCWKIPWKLVDMNIAPNNKYSENEPISYRHNIRKDINDKTGTTGYNGLVIILEEAEDER